MGCSCLSTPKVEQLHGGDVSDTGTDTSDKEKKSKKNSCRFAAQPKRPKIKTIKEEQVLHSPKCTELKIHSSHKKAAKRVANVPTNRQSSNHCKAKTNMVSKDKNENQSCSIGGPQQQRPTDTQTILSTQDTLSIASSPCSSRQPSEDLDYFRDKKRHESICNNGIDYAPDYGDASISEKKWIFNLVRTDSNTQTHTHTYFHNSDGNDDDFALPQRRLSGDDDACSVSGFPTRAMCYYDSDQMEKYAHISACTCPVAVQRSKSASSVLKKKSNRPNPNRNHNFATTTIIVSPPESLHKSRSGADGSGYCSPPNSVGSYSVYVEPPDGVSHRGASRSPAPSDGLSVTHTHTRTRGRHRHGGTSVNPAANNNNGEDGLLLVVHDMGSITPRPVHILDTDEWSSGGDDNDDHIIKDKTPTDFGSGVDDDGDDGSGDGSDDNSTPLMSGFAATTTNQRLLRLQTRHCRKQSQTRADGKLSINSMTRDNSISGF